jgi:hypothetical protein
MNQLELNLMRRKLDEVKKKLEVTLKDNRGLREDLELHQEYLDREKNRSELLFEKVVQYERKYNELKIEIEKAFDNWALGNFDDERFHIEIQLLVHNFYSN